MVDGFDGSITGYHLPVVKTSSRINEQQQGRCAQNRRADPQNAVYFQ